MAGAVQINPDTPKRNTNIAFRDKNGQWRAGSEAPGYERGQFIPTKETVIEYQDPNSGNTKTQTRISPGGNVGRAYTNRQRTNLIRKHMRKDGITEEQAREKVRRINQQLKEAIDEGQDIERIKDIRRQRQGS